MRLDSRFLLVFMTSRLLILAKQAITETILRTLAKRTLSLATLIWEPMTMHI